MSDELGHLIKKYIAALSQKDDDIFTLYESNKRLMLQLQQASSEAQATRQTCTTTAEQLQSTQTELRAQCEGYARLQNEHALLRRAAHEVVELLDDCRPAAVTPTGGTDKECDSPLASGLVAAVQHLYRRYGVAGQMCQTARACMAQQNRRAEQMLQHSEARERALLVSSASVERAQLCEFAWTTLDMLAGVRQEVESACGVQVQHYQQSLMCAHKAATELHRRWTRCAAERDEMKGAVRRWQSDEAHHRLTRDECVTAATKAVQLLSERAIAAESQWLCTVLALRKGAEMYSAAVRHAAAREAILQQEHEHERDGVERRRRETQARLRGAQQRCRYMQQRVRGGKAQARSLCRRVRRRHRRRRDVWRARLRSVQRTSEDVQLHAQQQRREHQWQTLSHEETVARLSLQLTESETRGQMVSAHAEERQRSTTLQLARRQVACDLHKNSLLSELLQSEDTQRTLLLSWECDTRAQMAEASAAEGTTLRRAQRATQAMREEFVHWVEVAESLQREVGTARAAVARAQTARRIWEAQHSDETRVLRAVMSRVSSDTTPSTSAARVAEERVVVLDEACRRSASVIAQLREALHRARMDVPVSDNKEIIPH